MTSRTAPGFDEGIRLAATEAYLESVCANPYDVNGDGSVWVRCNSRLVSKCPACSKLFQGDWAAICRNGIIDADAQPLKARSGRWLRSRHPRLGRCIAFRIDSVTRGRTARVASFTSSGRTWPGNLSSLGISTMTGRCCSISHWADCGTTRLRVGGASSVKISSISR